MQYQPSQAMLDNIKRGQVFKQKYKRTSLAGRNNEQLIEKSKAVFDAGFDIEAVKLVYNTLVKLEKSVDFRQRLDDGGPTEDAIKFYAFGGEAGLAWSRMILQQEQILKSYVKKVTQADTEVKGTDEIAKLPVVKSLNEELMQATFIVMVPNEVDAHGDITTEDEVRKACHNFNKHSMQANLFHLAHTDTFEFAESYILMTDMVVGEHLVTKGSWICTIQCLDDGLWELIKSGEICSVSIGAVAQVEEIE